MMLSESPLYLTVYHLGSWGGYSGLSFAVNIMCCCYCAELIQTQMLLATGGAKFAGDDVDDVIKVSSLLDRLLFRELGRLLWMTQIQYNMARKK